MQAVDRVIFRLRERLVARADTGDTGDHGFEVGPHLLQDIVGL
ncbi:Uncharacterised protein [Mycobacteroides abscessus subsp. abscessus]|nr:Uncharacterised protein [Mycobacteroides abscessus subsp. abscessus]